MTRGFFNNKLMQIYYMKQKRSKVLYFKVFKLFFKKETKN